MRPYTGGCRPARTWDALRPLRGRHPRHRLGGGLGGATGVGGTAARTAARTVVDGSPGIRKSSTG
ncbi:MAG: hypothetical protein GY719_19970 [bacterium]|nr:hypothetical protein [bacterium]